jgi:hypothetical protein
MTLSALLKVLVRNDFQVDTQCLGRLAHLVVLGVFNQVYGLCEELFNGAEIRAAEIQQPPLFVLGHWRSGTTHLHNLLSLDKNCTAPTAYQVHFPNHFLFTQVNAWLFDLIAPKKRPMDNVAFGSHVPHEDEFALASHCGVSPFLTVLFPVTGDKQYAQLDPKRLPSEALDLWKESLVLLIKKLTLSSGGRIVLKSPPHMGRVSILLEMFPGAQFVHIVRDPYTVYLSTRKLWKASFEHTHLQIPGEELIDEIILSWYEELFALFERDRELIPEGAIHEMKYEDLEARPVETLRELYEALRLPGFQQLEERMVVYLKGLQTYEKNVYELDDRTRKKVSERWRRAFERYDYPV